MLFAQHALQLQDTSTAAWHAGTAAVPADCDGLHALLLQQHLANFELWHLEDRARDPEASDAEIRGVKREIDAANQRRHDWTERTDEMLLDTLVHEGRLNPAAELHSETPGLMLDRLSILSLKIFHTREEMARGGAPAGHAERNRERLAMLEEQRSDLAGCLDRLWMQARAGERRFRLYRQLKMYNDPTLNPAVYGATQGVAQTGAKERGNREAGRL